MTDDLLTEALTLLGRRPEAAADELAGSMSQSSVYRVRLGGQDAVLKVTRADEERELARRELAFYRSTAAAVPVRTPRLLEAVDTDRLTALVLTAHDPAPPVRQWTSAEWIDLARELAELHEFPLPRGPVWNHTPWLQRILDDPPLDTARTYWSHATSGLDIGEALERLDGLRAALACVPACFIHGDCLVGNLLRENGHTVWADWTVTGSGYPTIDLASLYGRAHSDSASPPYEEMLDAYATERGIDAADLHRSMLAARIATLLFGWPDFAHYHSPAEQERTIQQLPRLLTQWRESRV